MKTQVRIVLLQFSIAGIALMLATTQAKGQAVVFSQNIVQIGGPAEATQLPPGVELPPGVQLPPGARPPNPAAGATNAPVSPEEKRLQELLKLSFDRRASSVLQALAKQAEEKAASTNEVQKFQADVVAGNWPAVKEFMARLPTNHVAQVYKHLLGELQKAPQASMPQPMPFQPGGAPPPGPVLLPDDVLALAEVVPGELTEEQVELLGKTLGVALSKGNFIDSFIAKLDAGTERLGGQDPKKRDLAAKLLIAANRLTDAGKFLPPLEPALEKNEIKTLDLHARYLVAVGKDGSRSSSTNAAASLRKAWDLTQTILFATNSVAKERELALNRSLELMPLITKEMGTNWLRDSFQKRPEQGMAIIAAVGGLVAQNVSNRDTELRRKNLELQRRVVDALLSVAGYETKPWETALNLLALGWIQEADFSKMRYFPRRNMNQQFDPYGNPIYYDYMPQPYQDPNQLPPVPVDQVLPTAPNDAWLAVLDKSLLPRLRILIAELYYKVEEEAKAMPYIEAVAVEQPKAALNLANEFLRTWARTHNPNQQDFNMQRRYYYNPYGQMQPQGIPLTRAMQVRSLKELSEWLQRLRHLPIGPLDDQAVVGAFSAAHSQAEVFRVEDIESVFGPVVDLKPETLSELLQTMRQRLAGQWRQPRVQQDAKTKRNDKEIDAEVMRGYQLVTELIEKGLAKQPDDWRMNLVQGAAMFDWAEFDYGKKVDLAIYTEKRDRAFRAFEKAAELYAAKVPSLDEKNQTAQVYQQWFNATLGASDLAYLTRQTEPNTNHLDKIRGAVLALPGDAPERHLAAFGKALSESANTLRPELKPRYLRAGIRIVSDHESATEARKLATYYDDLLQEITLDVQVDGDTTVGHTKPFGVFVALRHSEALGRESGGFGKYLQNQQNQNNFYNPYGTPPVNYRDDFEKQVKEKLGDGFEIVSVTFHEDKVQPRGYGRPGWRETPYAYLLLKARDASVDRIPPLQLDIDFFDRRGQVVLPVVSLVQLIDARPASVAPRPVAKVELLQILDERDFKKGQLTLEVKATGRGLLPELKDLLDVTFPGLKLDKIDDKGLTIAKMDTEGDQVAPVAERNWLINLRADQSGEVPTTFNFPKAKTDGVELVYKRYADADLADVKPSVALSGIPLKPANIWKWIWPGVIALTAAGLWLWSRKRKVATAVTETPVYSIPGHITPFTVLNLLRRMNEDQRLTLTAEQRRELAGTIEDLQKRFFSRATQADAAPGLEQIARQWLAFARAG